MTHRHPALHRTMLAETTNLADHRFQIPAQHASGEWIGDDRITLGDEAGECLAAHAMVSQVVRPTTSMAG